MIHYQTTGNGSRWLVFVHGLSCDNTDWSAQLAAFQYDFRCLTVDLRGHGQSAELDGPLDIETHASDLNQVLRHLEISGALLVGHSMGTRVIASAAIQAPECTGGLVFVDGSLQGRGEPIQAAENLQTYINQQESVAAFMDCTFSMMFTEHSDADIRAQIIQRATQMHPDKVIEQMRLMMMWDAGRAVTVFSQLKIPLTILQSTSVNADRKRVSLGEGEISPYAEEVTGLVPHAVTRIVPGCGHFTQIEAADITNEVIRVSAEQLLRSLKF